MSRVLESEFAVVFFIFWNYLTVGTKYILFVVEGSCRRPCLSERYWSGSEISIILLSAERFMTENRVQTQNI